MTKNPNRDRLNQVLRLLADELDVSPSKYREAKTHYDAVGAWLDVPDSALTPYRPIIYPQGSFALGTAVRPIGDEEYDVDCVCLLQSDYFQVTQQLIKKLVGDRLKHPRSRYRNMIEPKEGGRRCWTIRYADASKFHLDVLPAIPDDYKWLVGLGVPTGWARTAIRLTDTKTWGDTIPEWPRSNPKGYIAWFKDRMRVSLEHAKRLHAESIRAEVEEIEDFDVRTPLQRIIQILKRHRDMRYNGDPDKPISIIITTLAARSYDDEFNLVNAMLTVLSRMREFIELREGDWWVPNPVNPMENFADKWNEEPRKAQIFFKWLGSLEDEFRALLTDRDFAKLGDYLPQGFGQRDAQAVMRKFYIRESNWKRQAGIAPVILAPRKADRATTPKIKLPSRPSKPWSP